MLILLFIFGSFVYCNDKSKLDFAVIKDKWLNLFGYIVLDHNLDSIVDLGSNVDILIDL